MVRRKKEGKVSAITEYRRKRAKLDPEWHKKQKDKRKEYYQKTKRIQSEQKSLREKKSRQNLYKYFGNKCECCGESYNKNAKRTNLEFHHKGYPRIKGTFSETHRQVQDLLNHGLEPRNRFALLCRICHMAITYMGKDIRKGKEVMRYIKKEKLLDG